MNYQSGFVALSTVLILGALFLVLAVSLSLRSVQVSTQQISQVSAAKAKAAAIACAEVVLLKITQSLHYTGAESINLTDSSCDIGVMVETTDGTRRVEITGQSNDHTARFEIDISETSPDISIDQYISVSSF